jgi:hypothetical protein
MFEFGDGEMTNREAAQLISGVATMISAMTKLRGWRHNIPKIVSDWAWMDHLEPLEDFNPSRRLPSVDRRDQTKRSAK